MSDPQNPHISAHHGKAWFFHIDQHPCIFSLISSFFLSYFLHFCWLPLPLSLTSFHPFIFYPSMKTFLCTYYIADTVPRDPIDALCLGRRGKFLSLPHTPANISRLESVAWASPLKGQASGMTCESNIHRLESQFQYLPVVFILSTAYNFLVSILSSVK